MKVDSLFMVGNVTFIPELVEEVRKDLSSGADPVQCVFSADRLECAAQGAWWVIYEKMKGRLSFSSTKGIWLRDDVSNCSTPSENCILVGMEDNENCKVVPGGLYMSNAEVCYNSAYSIRGQLSNAEVCYNSSHSILNKSSINEKSSEAASDDMTDAVDDDSNEEVLSEVNSNAVIDEEMQKVHAAEIV